MSDSHKAVIVPVIEPRDGQRMHPLVSRAMEVGSFDPQTLRELLAVQRDYEAGEAKKAYTRALAGLKADLPAVIAKDATVDFENSRGARTFYKHATLAGVMDAIIDPLTRHGFSLSWTPATGDRAVRVTCKLTHTEGHHEEATLEAPADTSGSKNPAQAIASTITLLQRYTALALLGIATRDMTEPTGEETAKAADGDRIDADQNMRAVKAITRRGHTREEAEKVVAKARGETDPVPVSKWTGADRRAIKAWLGIDDSPVGEPTNP